MTALQFKQARKSRKMDQRQLASFLKCSYSAVTKWESGSNPVPSWVEEKLTDVSGKFILTGLEPDEISALEKKAASKGMSADSLIAEMIRA